MDPSLERDAAEDAVLTGRILVDRYKLDRRIGRGDLGDVYAAQDLLRLAIADEAKVAVKVFHPDLVRRWGGVRALSPKLSAACGVSHPHFLNAYDFCQDDDRVLLAMELLTGPTLAQRLANKPGEPPMEIAEAHAALKKIVDALAYRHSRTGSPLLRLHPGRIRLSGEDRSLCIADLGLGCLIDPPLLCQSAMTNGNAAYLAPEVVASEGDPGKAPDLSTDQFSLGALAMVLFTGSPRGSTSGLRRSLAKTEASVWTEILPRLLAEKPTDRFGDFSEIHDLLQDTPKFRRQAKPKRRRLHAADSKKADVTEDRGGSRKKRRPLILATAAIAVLALAVFAWVFGPGLLSRQRMDRTVGSRIDEARLEVQHIDTMRLDLLARAINRDPFDLGARRLAEAKPDYSIIELIAAAAVELEKGETDAAKVRLSSIKSSLATRREEFRHAIAAVDACDRLSDLRKTTADLSGFLPLDRSASGEQLAVAWRNAAGQFSAGEFQTAGATATTAADAGEVGITLALETARTETIEARANWRSALKAVGDFPRIEPIGEPARQLAIADEALDAGNPVKAARYYVGARDRYASWAAELMASGSPANSQPGAGRENRGPDIKQAPAFRNSLGMELVPVGKLLASVWETRVIDYLAFTEESGVDAGYQWRDFAATGKSLRRGDDDSPENLSVKWSDPSAKTIQGPCHPVTSITPADAKRFCEWLTRRERADGRIPENRVYRLPTDLEWSRLAGLSEDPEKTPRERSFDRSFHFPWGTEPVRLADSGNYATWPNRDKQSDLKASQDPFEYTAPVGSFAANAAGLHDLGGNVWEWTSDNLHDKPRNEPRYKGLTVIRGGGWGTFDLQAMRTACRDSSRSISPEVGFRVVLASPLAGPGTSADSTRSASSNHDESDGNGG